MSRERERFEEIGKKIKREADNASSKNNMHHHHQIIMGRTLNTVTPCAACKLLRRRCAQECPFSPYFSPHEPHKFASVHRVFGASNVSKMLLEVPENQRADAANSLVYEANVRLRDPVYGCMGAISALQQQIQALQAEINAVRAEILRYKYREATISATPLPSHLHHLADDHNSLLSPARAVSVAVPPPAPPPPPRVPLPSSSSSSMYTQPTSASDYSTLSSENISFFG